MKQGTILIADDNRNILTAVKVLLEDTFETIVAVANPGNIPARLRDDKPDVVLLDMNFQSGVNNGNEGLYWLRQIKKLRPQAQVVLFTAYADIELAVTGLKEGAADFVVKPFDNAKLLSVLTDAYRKAQPQKGAAGRGGSHMLWGASPRMLDLKATVEKVAATDANILLTGENGTGKEVLANEIHRLSRRAAAKMLPVDMGAITGTLFESELFGHVKGAFTDAKADKPGKFELADGGTLFLDEIGNLDYALQAKLLTALQRRSIVRVGGTKAIPIDVRLVCATNRRGLALPHQHNTPAPAAPARAQRGHSGVGEALPRPLRHDVQQARNELYARCRAQNEGSAVVRQHTRTATRGGEGGNT